MNRRVFHCLGDIPEAAKVKDPRSNVFGRQVRRRDALGNGCGCGELISLMHRARTLIAPRKIAGEARAYNPPREERQTSPPAASEVFGLKVHWPILRPTIRLNKCNECDVVIVTQYPGAVFAWIATASS